jgi:predicted outer membrane protein
MRQLAATLALALVALLGLAPAALAEDPTPPPTPACVSCHGTGG